MSDRERTLRVGLVGCGEVTRFKHLPAMLRTPGIEVAALADSDDGRLHAVADQYRVAARHSSVEHALRESELDAVAVCVPAHAHAAVALAVLAAGKHLLIEKPLCLSLDEADRLRETAARVNVRLLVGHHMRFHRLIRAARALVDRGALGTVESVRTVWNSPRIGRDNPEWRFRRERGGGVLVEIAVHAFDLWRFLLRAEVADVYATSRAGQRDDESLAVVATMENGMLASGLFSENAPHEIEVEICGSAARLRIGCLRFDGFELVSAGAAPGELAPRVGRMTNFLRELPRGLRELGAGGDYFGSYRAEWRHFRDAIRGAVAVECSLEDGRRSLEVVIAAAESANRGERIRVCDAPRVIPAAKR